MSSDLEEPPTLTPPPPEPESSPTEPKPMPKPPDLVLKPGDEIGNYIVEGKIGQGGMGAVYKAKHKELGRVAAIKFMLAIHGAKADFAARFQNEAKLSNRVQHPGIVQVFETGRLPTGELFMIMELLEGQTLSSHLRAAAQTHAHGMGMGGLGILRQIASAMAVAHSQNVIHRDLKPGNLILVDDPEVRDGYRVKILDFGIAKFVERPDTPIPSHLDPVHTTTGAQVGSPPYMSPELWTGSKMLDDRVDCYALGIIAYQVLANNAPFDLNKSFELTHRFDQPKSLKDLNPNLPDSLCQLVERLLAKEPSDRPSMAEFRDELSKMMGLKPGPTTRSVPALPAPKQAEVVVSISGADFSESAVADTVGGGAAGPRPISGASALNRPDSLTGPKNADAPAMTAISNRRRGRTKLAVGIGAALLVALAAVLLNLFTAPRTKVPASHTTASAVPAALPIPGEALPDLSAPAPTPSTITKPAGASDANPDGKSHGTKRPHRKQHGPLIPD